MVMRMSEAERQGALQALSYLAELQGVEVSGDRLHGYWSKLKDEVTLVMLRRVLDRWNETRKGFPVRAEILEVANEIAKEDRMAAPPRPQIEYARPTPAEGAACAAVLRALTGMGLPMRVEDAPDLDYAAIADAAIRQAEKDHGPRERRLDLSLPEEAERIERLQVEAYRLARALAREAAAKLKGAPA